MGEARAGADRFRRPPGRDDGARRAVPDDARQHRASDHRRAGHQHAGRPRPRAHRSHASTRSCRHGGKRGRVPELWDGHAAERIAADLSTWLRPALARRSGSARMNAHACRRRRDRQRADDRRRGLLPGLGVRAAHPARDLGQRSECRVERNIDRILGLLDAKRTSARPSSRSAGSPNAIRRWSAVIVAGGHELASHGYGHRRASEQGRRRLPAPTFACAKAILEDIAGREVHGYRAPSFSIGHGQSLGVRLLADAGYRYSSSIYPIRHDHYGMPDAPRFALRSARPGLIEMPVATVRMLKRNWPAGGGGYFRLLPYGCRAGRSERVNAIDRQARDVLFPSMGDRSRRSRASTGIGAKTRFRHYVNLRPHGAAPAEAARRLPLGPRRSRLPATALHDGSRGRHVTSSASARACRSCQRRVRSLPATAALGRLRRRAARRRPSSTASAGATSSRTSSATARTTWSPSATDAIAACCRSREVNSRLFGHSLVSLPFGVYGGRRRHRRGRRARAGRSGRGACARRSASSISNSATASASVPGWPQQDLYVTFRKDAAQRPRGEPAGDSAQAARDGAQGHHATG